MRTVFAIGALFLSVPASAAPGDAVSPGKAFANAWVDRASTISFARQAVQDKLETCLKSGQIAPEVLEAERPLLDLYLETFFGGIERVQDRVADKAQGVLAPADLRALTHTFSTPAFRIMRRQALARMAQKMVPAIPGCGNEGRSVTLGELASGALPHMTPAQMTELRKIVVSPAWQHFNRALPQLMPVLNDAFRDEVAHALRVAGASPDAIQEARTAPSPIVPDPPHVSP